jgi:two-component system, OmpR family, phosphate regulon sensor histidine kinase PhoR
MTLLKHQGLLATALRWFARGLPVVTAAVLFAILALVLKLDPMVGQAGFAVVTIAVVIREAILWDRRKAPPHSDRMMPAIVDRTVAAVVSDLPDPTIVLTPASTVMAFNETAQEIASGIASGEPISFALRDPNVLGAIRAVAADRQMRHIEFFQRVPTDRWWDVIIAPLVVPGQAGLPRHLVLLSLHDQTPVRRVEEMRADFVANASHELRTPLASLSGFIETLQGPARNDPSSRDRFLAIMKEQATRMARLIDDLLSLSRIEQKAHIHPDTTTDLVVIVNEVTDSLSPLARERDVEIKISGCLDSLEVMGDRDELIRVFENLIENALKYGASGKRVDITLSREPSTGEARDALASVRDYGPGIAPEHVPRLTERFYRVDIGESRAQGGTGLGLALVKHILNRHRGRLMIESVPGAGANFSVRLPLSRSGRAAQTLK